MPSTSPKQRRFMGLALAIKQGKAKARGAAAKIAEQMSAQQLSDFARKSPKSRPHTKKYK